MKYDGIIFDLDGTLWDSLDALHHCWRIFVEKRHLELPSRKEFELAMGLSVDDFMQRLFPTLTKEEHKELFKECTSYENEYLSIHGGDNYEGVYELLETLSKNHKVCIVSNCEEGYIEAFIKSSKVENFISDYLCHGTFGLPKSENIKIAVERNNLKSAVYVGDTALDMQSATTAGIPFIHASYGFGKFDCPFSKIQKPQDLLNLVE